MPGQIPTGYVEDATPTQSILKPPSGYVEDHVPPVSFPKGEGSGSPLVDTFLEHVGSQLNPMSWLGALRQQWERVKGGGVSPEDWDTAHRLVDAADKRGSILPILTGKEDGTLADYAAGTAGDITGGAALAGIAHLATKLPGVTGLVKADPSKDLINVYGIKDPRAPENLKTAVADLDHDSGSRITSNEHLATTSPKYAARPAFDFNRAVWNEWKDAAGDKEVAPDSIMRSASSSLKDFEDPSKKVAIMKDLHTKLMDEPLTADRLEEINRQINNELKTTGFYSKDEAARSAARLAGAQTGRSQAFLESVGQGVRNELYNLMDPEGKGEGPREVQRRYGYMKMVTDPATEARSDIYAENAGTPLKKASDLATSLLNIPGKAVTGQLTNPAEGLQTIFRGKSDPIIERAFKNAPEYRDLPRPNKPVVAASPIVEVPPTAPINKSSPLPIPGLTPAQQQYLRESQARMGKVTLADLMRAKDIE